MSPILAFCPLNFFLSSCLKPCLNVYFAFRSTKGTADLVAVLSAVLAVFRVVFCLDCALRCRPEMTIEPLIEQHLAAVRWFSERCRLSFHPAKNQQREIAPNPV